MKNNDIKDGLDRCESELDAAMNMFHVSLLKFSSSLASPEQAFADEVSVVNCLLHIC